MRLTRRDMILMATTALLAPRVPAWAASTGTAESGPLGNEAVAALLRKHKVPGASLVIFEEGAIFATSTYGVARAATGEPVNATTRFQGASLSKTINALLILKLVEAGTLKLSDKVNDHLKSWTLGGKNAGLVTIKSLLSHTAGVTVNGFDGYDPARPVPPLLAVLDGKPPANSPPIKASGKFGVFAYSGGGVTVLQQMVIEVTGEEYGAAAKRLVLDPLGMSNSSFAQPPSSGDKPPVAYAHSKDGRQIRGNFNVYPELAAAGIWTTPTDMAQAVMAIMNSAEGAPGSFLPRELATEMLIKVHTDAGLGVFINGRGRFYHNGVNRGFRNVFVADPRPDKKRRGLVVMTNGENGAKVHDTLLATVVKEYGWT